MNKEGHVVHKIDPLPTHCAIRLSQKDTFYMFHVAYIIIETFTKLTKVCKVQNTSLLRRKVK
jgi:hypothetical protein